MAKDYSETDFQAINSPDDVTVTNELPNGFTTVTQPLQDRYTVAEVADRFNVTPQAITKTGGWRDKLKELYPHRLDELFTDSDDFTPFAIEALEDYRAHCAQHIPTKDRLPFKRYKSLVWKRERSQGRDPDPKPTSTRTPAVHPDIHPSTPAPLARRLAEDLTPTHDTVDIPAHGLTRTTGQQLTPAHVLALLSTHQLGVEAQHYKSDTEVIEENSDRLRQLLADIEEQNALNRGYARRAKLENLERQGEAQYEQDKLKKQVIESLISNPNLTATQKAQIIQLLNDSPEKAGEVLQQLAAGKFPSGSVF